MKEIWPHAGKMLIFAFKSIILKPNDMRKKIILALFASAFLCISEANAQAVVTDPAQQQGQLSPEDQQRLREQQLQEAKLEKEKAAQAEKQRKENEKAAKKAEKEKKEKEKAAKKAKKEQKKKEKELKKQQKQLREQIKHLVISLKSMVVLKQL